MLSWGRFTTAMPMLLDQLVTGKGSSFTYHVKGNLFLTGDEWSSERRNDDRGHPSAYAWYFDFNEGRSDNQPSGFPYPSFPHACVVCAWFRKMMRVIFILRFGGWPVSVGVSS